MTIKKNSILF